MRRMTVGFLCLACFGLFGCGDDIGQCETAARAMCQKACDCGGGDCRIASVGDGGTAAGALSFDDQDACLNFFVGLGCAGGGNPDIDYAACSSALETAMCVSTGGANAIASPPACDTE